MGPSENQFHHVPSPNFDWCVTKCYEIYKSMQVSGTPCASHRLCKSPGSVPADRKPPGNQEWTCSQNSPLANMFLFFASDFFPVLFNWLQQATCKPVPSSSLAIASKRALEELWTLARRFKDSKTMQDLKNISKITLINIESTLRFWHSAGHAPHKNMVQNASVTVDLMPKPQANLPPPVHQAVQIWLASSKLAKLCHEPTRKIVSQRWRCTSMSLSKEVETWNSYDTTELNISASSQSIVYSSLAVSRGKRTSRPKVKAVWASNHMWHSENQLQCAVCSPFPWMAVHCQPFPFWPLLSQGWPRSSLTKFGIHDSSCKKNQIV